MIEKPPDYHSVLVHRKNPIILLYIFFSVVSFALYNLVKYVDLNVSTTPEFCASYYPISHRFHPDNPEFVKCLRYDLFAFQITFSIPMIFVSIVSVRSWYVTRDAFKKIPQTPEGRLFGYLYDNDIIATMNFVHQVWNFSISWFVPEYCTVVWMSHHVVTAILCYYGMHYQLLNFYGVYFVGLTELSSIFLLIISLGKYFPPPPQSLYSRIVGVAGPCFVACFIYYRVILWLIVSYQFWTDIISVIRSGSAKRYRPNKVYPLYIYLIANIFMTALQLYWFVFKIIPEVVDFFSKMSMFNS